MKKLILLLIIGLGVSGWAANEVRVYGTVYDTIDTADAIENVLVYVELTRLANNTCDSTITPPRQKMKPTNSNGYFFFELLKSSCLDSAKYKIWFEYEGQKSKVSTFLAPDQDSVDIFTLIN